MKDRITSNSIRIASLIFIFGFLQACVANLPAVREFSKATIIAADSFDRIAEDLPKSCLRRAEISFTSTPEDKIDIKGGKISYSKEYLRNLSACDDLKNSLNGLINVNNVLTLQRYLGLKLQLLSSM